MSTYADYTPLTFHDFARRFADGNDSPRAYLECCLETIAEREGLHCGQRERRACCTENFKQLATAV